jgi:hypothetical protein
MPPEVRPGGSLVVTVRLTLQPGRDDDLIALVQLAPRGRLAAMVREAMRSGISSKTVTFETEADAQPLDMSGLGMDV